jgi:putative ABC transport system permease protein
VEGVTGIVSPGYFNTMGIPVLAGRDFTEAEYGRRTDESGLVILSRAQAQQLFPNGDAVGSRLLLQHPPKMQVEVIGVVGDVRGRPITADPEPMAYEPAGQRWPATYGSIVLRSSLPPEQIAASVRAVTRSIDAAFAPPRLESFAQMIDGVLSEQRLFARLSGLFAVVAALLAGIGIYAMMAGSVAERRREFGIRLALGARHALIARLVLKQALVLGGIGVVLGLVGAAALRKIVESRLFGVSSADPFTLGGAGAAVVLLCALASLLPALRASRTDPVRSLRLD